MRLVNLKKIFEGKEKEFGALESLVKAALFDHELEVRQTAIEEISKACQGAIRGGYVKENKMFVTVQIENSSAVIGYINEAPKTYLGKNIKQHPFALGNSKIPTA